LDYFNQEEILHILTLIDAAFCLKEEAISSATVTYCQWIFIKHVETCAHDAASGRSSSLMAMLQPLKTTCLRASYI